jgi:hypothetical protein
MSVRVGDTVLYLHPEDDELFPALVARIREDSENGNDFAANLFVLRPRGETWLWASEGDQPGQYRVRD